VQGIPKFKKVTGYVDASIGGFVEVPSSSNRGEGDIHIYGNPHYWLDPLTCKVIGRNYCQWLKGDPLIKHFMKQTYHFFL